MEGREELEKGGRGGRKEAVTRINSCSLYHTRPSRVPTAYKTVRTHVLEASGGLVAACLGASRGASCRTGGPSYLGSLETAHPWTRKTGKPKHLHCNSNIQQTSKLFIFLILPASIFGTARQCY